jgi:Flp pilus assembly protein TadD
VVVLVALAAATSARVRVWKDSGSLFLDALEKTRENYLAHLNLGHFSLEAGRTDEALGHFREAERIRPDEPEVHVGLGYTLLLLGRQDEAARSFERALRIEPRHSVALNNLARIRFLEGDVSESARLYRATAAAKPDWAEGHRRLGIALLMQGETGPAQVELERALALDPSDREARSLLDGIRALGRGGDPSADALRAFLADSHRQAAAALRRRGLSARAADEESKAQSLSIPAR